MEITYKQLMIAGIALGAVVGLIVAGVLYYLGSKKNKKSLGIVGALLSIVTGPLSLIFPLIIGGVFGFLIFRKTENNLPEKD